MSSPPTLVTVLARRMIAAVVVSILVVALWAIGTSWIGALIGGTQWVRTAASSVPPLLSAEEQRAAAAVMTSSAADPALLASLAPGESRFLLDDGTLRVAARGPGRWSDRTAHHDITNDYLVGLRGLIDAEVLVLDPEGAVIANSLRTTDGAPASPLLLPHPSWTTEGGRARITVPGYAGFVPGRAELGTQTGETFGVFHSSFVLRDDQERPIARLVVLVPSKVTMFGPKAAAGGAALVALLCILGSTLTIKRLVRDQIVPLAEVTGGLDTLSASVRDELGAEPTTDGADDASAPSLELARLRAAFGALPPLLERWRAATAELVEARDTLQRQAAELESERDRAQAAERHKTRFLATVSHELRTPLTGLLGLSDALLDSPLQPSERGKVETLHECGEHLRVLLEELLEFSAIESSGVTLAPRPTDIAALARGSVEMLRPSIEERGITLTCVTPEEPLPFLRLDPVRVRQILVNLLSNARKFTETGGIELAVEAVRDGEIVHVTLAVTDTGQGIPEDARARVFEAFVQAHSQPSQSFGGVGLGLSICQRIVSQMGGTIAAVDPPGGLGSRIEVRLPCEAQAPPVRQADVASPHFAGARVLIVDDIDFNREVVAMYLRKLGCEPLSAPSGPAALRALAEQDIDLVLMDCYMPGMDGFETTRALRADLALPRVPIIALTADSQPSNHALCADAGMDHLLAKPIQLPLLADALARWLPARPRVAV